MKTIFTDGASRGNPGPGGWGCIVVDDKHVHEFGDRELRTTNNRMEIAAALCGAGKVSRNENAIIYTDSSYLINGITKWVHGWKKNGWMTKTKEPVLNKDLWEKLDDAADGRNIEWKYVGGHIGVGGNERCDEIATSFADGKPAELYSGPLSGYFLPNILNVSHNADLHKSKKDSSGRAKMKAYSYVSRVGGVVETHKNWADCESRVKGKSGAKFKKAITKGEETEIIKEFQSR